ncbi:aldose 1-epimerase family protein [Clostridium fallax]|uniref:Galactose mutarotase n=1 Tax=Clostridium fallax TaxID=1533 RepID=A0A1M4SUZ5_9CLOT|nr:aldose 1-epimerase family protein [Clostridium fallax]SHE36034.1 Galactose mutarotase [Clostridium fallax]SQB07986.1 aldose-1-epimerase [Clostridium fallax]
MITTIQNEFLSASIKSFGAELCSLKLLENNKEFIWQGDPKYWAKHSPILFPILGGTNSNNFIYENFEFSLSKHGFARDLDFEIVNKQSDSIKYLLKYNPKTLRLYPFKFELYITYKLTGKSLNISYEVKNIDNKKIYFSIGGHPAFNCPIDLENEFIEFEKAESLETFSLDLDKGLLKNSKDIIKNNCKELNLDYNLFSPQDTLIFENLNSKFLVLGNKNENEKIKISFGDFPYLALWFKKAPFICIEPWFGLPDFIDSNKVFKDKIGLTILDAKNTFNCSYDIEII